VLLATFQKWVLAWDMLKQIIILQGKKSNILSQQKHKHILTFNHFCWVTMTRIMRIMIIILFLRLFRFGRGLYFAHNSSKANDYTSPNSTTGLRVMFQCDVACGKVYCTQYDMTSLTSPPSGYDSVEGVPGGSLNYPEMVVYNEDAVMPRYIVFYKYN
jgi:hypothetical protein